jgi:hypothetical protein
MPACIELSILYLLSFIQGWSNIRGQEVELEISLGNTLDDIGDACNSFRNQMVLTDCACPMWRVIREAVYDASVSVFGSKGRIGRQDVLLTALSSQNVPRQGMKLYV